MLLVGTSNLLHADPNECLAHPTQNCVFELAIDVADAKGNAMAWSQEMLGIAVVQESVQPERSQETLTRVFAEMRERERNSIKVSWHLGFFRDMEKWLSMAPQSSKRLAAEISKRREQFRADPAKPFITSATRLRSFTNDRQQVFDAVRKAPDFKRASFVHASIPGFLASGNLDKLLELTDMIYDVEARGEILRSIASKLTRTGRVDDAVRIVTTIPVQADQMQATAGILYWQMQMQQFCEAKQLAISTEERFSRQQILSSPLKGWMLIASLTSLYASLGDEARLRNLLPLYKSLYGTNHREDFLLAINAMVHGNVDKIFAVLDNFEKNNFSPPYRSIIDIYLDSGQTDLTRFIDFFSVPLSSDRSQNDVVKRLDVIAGIQYDRGDLFGAEITFARAQFAHEQIALEDRKKRYSPKQRAHERHLIKHRKLHELLELYFEQQRPVKMAELATMFD
jgi:hypothetical protein